MGVQLNAGVPVIPRTAGRPRSGKKRATSSSMLPIEALPTRSGHDERRATSPRMPALEALPVHSGSVGKRRAPLGMPPLEALPALSGHVERRTTSPTLPALDSLPACSEHGERRATSPSGHVEKRGTFASASPAPFLPLISLMDHAVPNGMHGHFMGALIKVRVRPGDDE
ncbi:hypothetical protein FIBSPDRAFT_975833 [Athelia psychrophila]|uniref:Uncharacterized protein n=1 Tax=Athelia psychrophila TaxID=1759441 RepID=A0A166F5B1_9AGAM|nr:hypothetical protein FIBSPDRAFT_975833 [Fibularhizoctonia sp. CBS 109695]